MKPIRKMQCGFTLVSAIFLLVIILALGTFTLTMTMTQQQASALDLQGSRAYQAARAGIEWGVYQILQQTSVINAGGINCSTGGSSQTITLPSTATTLSGFAVTVTCVSYASATEGSSTVAMYQLTSTATASGVSVGAKNYVERQVTVTIAN